MKLDHILTPLTKNKQTNKQKLTMDEGRECDTGNHQTHEEKAGKILFDLSVSKFLADTSPKARELKAK